MGWGFLQHIVQGDSKPGGGAFGFLNQKVVQPIKASIPNVPNSIAGSAVKIAAADVTHNDTARANASAGLKKAKQVAVTNLSDPKYVAGAVSEGGMGKLSKASTADEVSNILSKEGHDPQHIQKVAPAIAQTTDPHIIKNILDGNHKIQTQDINQPITQATQHFDFLNKQKEAATEAAKPTPIQENIGKEVDKIQGNHESYRKDGQLRVDATQQINDLTAKGQKIIKAQSSVPSPSPTMVPPSTPVDVVKPAGQGSAESLRSAVIPDKPLQPNLGESIMGNMAIKKASSAVSGEVIPPQSTFAKSVIDAIHGKPAAKGQASVKGLTGYAKEQAQLLSAARGEKIKSSVEAGKNLEGSQGYYAELSKLKGEAPQANYPGLVNKVGSDQAEQLFTQGRQEIQKTPDDTFTKLGLHPDYARLNTQTALRKYLFGEGVPTAGDIKLLNTVYGRTFGKEVEQSIPLVSHAKNLAAQLAGLPRAILASFDLSFGGRQGAVLGSRFPKEWAVANKESVKYLAKPKYYEQEMQKIASDPYFDVVNNKMKVALQAVGGNKEEAYAASDIAEKIPGLGKGVLASERAYNGGLTKMRYDVSKRVIDAYGGLAEVEKNFTPKMLRDLGEVINTASGRGGKTGGLIEKHMATLSTTLFSPRLWASRLNMLNPVYYARLSGPARKLALQSAGSFATVAGLVMAAATAAGATVETDPRSSDFLKPKFGNTRYDILGGFQQNLVFAWREITGEKKSAQTGKDTKFARSLPDIVTGKSSDEAGITSSPLNPNRLSVASDLAQNKLNPLFSTTGQIIKGTDKSGQPVKVANELLGLFSPLNFQDTYSAIKDTGSIPKGIIKGAPGIVGAGTQTFGVKDLAVSKNQKTYLDNLQTKGAPKDQVAASKLFFQTQKTGPDRDKASTDIKAALKANDTAKAEAIAQKYNKDYANTFKDWASKYGDKYGNDENLLKSYESKKITSDSLDRWLNEINNPNQGAL